MISLIFSVFGLLIIPLFSYALYTNKRTWFLTLVYELHKDKGVIPLLFYPLFLIRRSLYISILYFLPNYPKAQILLNTFLSALTIVYLLVYRPFKSPLIGKLILVTEALFGMILLSLFLYVLDREYYGQMCVLTFVVLISLTFLVCGSYSLLCLMKTPRADTPRKTTDNMSGDLDKKDDPPIIYDEPQVEPNNVFLEAEKNKNFIEDHPKPHRGTRI